MDFYPYSLVYDIHQDFISLCPLNEYRVTAPNSLSKWLPSSLLNKCNNVVVMASGSQLHNSVFVANCSRLDGTELDQNPYIIWFDHHNHTTTGGFIHHGGWQRRTVPLEPAFLSAIESSGIMAYYPYSEFPVATAGNLADLKVASHRDAFWNSVRVIGK
ncbi:hypothetical protein KKC91_11225 [bacterium]|nr:hypothetical protein [bacterium]